MSDSIDIATEHLEHAAHHRHKQVHEDDGHARKTAILVAVLAAALALTEMQEKGAQNEYLRLHIKASDDWAEYQAKTVRMNMFSMFADTWEATPGFSADKIKAARASAARMDDDPKNNTGRKQMATIAKHSEESREVAFHEYHSFEVAVGGMQIAIVLASVSVVTRVRVLALASGLLGAAAGALALWTAYGGAAH